MDRYRILRQLGDGSYGSVWQAMNRQTHEMVAIKRMKRHFFSWEECMALREVRSLRKLSHPCIVKLREVIRENNELFFIFEYLDHNLYQVMKQRQGNPFSEAQVRHWTYQILQGLEHMHSNGYFHRDMKPENLLVHGEHVIKIADFGLAREVHSQPPYTEYVSTRWYRAPEVLLRKADYSAPVDMFALGAIMAELFTLKPLFPGSTEIDEICKICDVVGTFTAETWPEGERLSRQMGFSLAPQPTKPLSRFVPQASLAALDLMTSLCQWDPARRPTAAQALQHPFFKDAVPMRHPVTPPVLRERTNTAPSMQTPVAGILQNPAALPLAAPFVPGATGPIPSLAAGRVAAAAGTARHPAMDWQPMRASMQAAAVVLQPSPGEKHARRPPVIVRKSTEQRPEQRRQLQLQLGQPPPDLWINAKTMAPTRQQGFSQIARGAPVRQGAWAAPPSPQIPAALKLGLACLPGSVPGSHSQAGPVHLIQAHRKATGPGQHHVNRRARKTSRTSQVGGIASYQGQPAGGDAARASMPELGLRPPPPQGPELGRLIGHAMPDAKMGDFGPMSASLRRAAAAGGQPWSGL